MSAAAMTVEESRLMNAMTYALLLLFIIHPLEMEMAFSLSVI